MPISKEKMNEIYLKIRTPYKYGPIVKKTGYLTDSPIVFKCDGKYYMSYVAIDSSCKGGYSTFLARTENMVDFEEICPILTEKGEWDKSQSGGYAQFICPEFGGANEIEKINGKYYFAYIGGNKTGYETDPLSMGLCVAEDITASETYKKFPKPILTGKDCDARIGETLTIYKADMFCDKKQTIGYPYVCAYNAKGSNNRESIFLAVSNDGNQWKRYGEKAIIDVRDCDKNIKINGDPQIVIIDDLYVLIYFVYENETTYNTFAVSKDLINWTKWGGEPIMKAEYEWENVHAHKQWIIKKDDIVYQYYCAVNDKNERFIALATSKPIK